MMTQLHLPTEHIVREYLELFRGDAVLRETEDALRTLFQQFPSNERCDEVLPKVATLNTLYNAGLLSIEIHPVARHICHIHIDERLRRGDLDVVHSIATPLTRGEFRCVYSFATKFASFHHPQAFAIYDEYVDSVLWEYALQHRFSRFQRNQLKIYPEFSRVVDDFVAHFDLARFTRKEIDMFLWLYGKERKGRYRGRTASAE
jgi:hypothetical protein